MAPLSSLPRCWFNHQRSFCFSLFLFLMIVIMRLSLQRFMISILLNSWIKLIAAWEANRIFLSWFKWWLLQSCWSFLAKFPAFESSSMSNLSWIRFQLSPTWEVINAIISYRVPDKPQWVSWNLLRRTSCMNKKLHSASAHSLWRGSKNKTNENFVSSSR